MRGWENGGASGAPGGTNGGRGGRRSAPRERPFLAPRFHSPEERGHFFCKAGLRYWVRKDS